MGFEKRLSLDSTLIVGKDLDLSACPRIEGGKGGRVPDDLTAGTPKGTEKEKTSMAKSKAAAVPATKPRKGGVAEKIDLQKAIELRLKGVAYQDIATFFGCTKTAVIQRLKPYVAATDIDTELFIKNRAAILANRQVPVLAAMTQEKLEKSSAKDLAVTFGVLFDKERLERGQSTSNQSVFFHIVQEACEAEDDDAPNVIVADPEK